MGRKSSKSEAKLERVRALFLDAAEAGDLAALGDLADSVDPALALRDGSDALMLAARAGRAAAVEFLLGVCDPMAACPPQIYRSWGPDGHGYDALMQAAKGGHADCVKLVLPRSDARRMDSNNRTALMHAVHSGSAACVSILAKAGDPRARGDVSRTQEALHIAARLGMVDCLEALLAVVPHDAKDGDGASAMHVAARWGQVACVGALLGKGVPGYAWEPAYQKGKGKPAGDNPMHWAASGASDESRSWEIVAMLMDKWDLAARGSRGMAVADLARASGKHGLADRVEAVLLAREQRAALARHVGGGAKTKSSSL